MFQNLVTNLSALVAGLVVLSQGGLEGQERGRRAPAWHLRRRRCRLAQGTSLRRAPGPCLGTRCTAGAGQHHALASEAAHVPRRQRSSYHQSTPSCRAPRALRLGRVHIRCARPSAPRPTDGRHLRRSGCLAAASASWATPSLDSKTLVCEPRCHGARAAWRRYPRGLAAYAMFRSAFWSE